MTELSDRADLARAITLIESKRPEDYDAKYALVRRARQSENVSIRVAITGAPGVGKSSLIEKMGLTFIDGGHRVAVLAIDPSSPSSGGSILGDKTRMEKLAANPSAFIRPTPSASQAGGVSEFTRETISLCEAGGYDVVLIETVGVGQGEYAVQGMSDVVVLVTIPGTGDGLQGIKRGIMEMADLILINKSDGVNEIGAKASLSEMRSALRISRHEAALPDVICTSAKSGSGIEKAVEAIQAIARKDNETGALANRRQQQEMSWFSDAVASRLKAVIENEDRLRVARTQLLALIEKGDVDPVSAAKLYVSAILRHPFDGA
jgi:LAO/AO transport system kinase